MTIREVCENIGIDENPLECGFAIAAALRTALQREPSTFDGECATLVAACNAHGEMNKPASIRKWLSALGKVPDMDLPDRFWQSIADANFEDELDD